MIRATRNSSPRVAASPVVYIAEAINFGLKYYFKMNYNSSLYYMKYSLSMVYSNKG